MGEEVEKRPGGCLVSGLSLGNKEISEKTPPPLRGGWVACQRYQDFQDSLVHSLEFLVAQLQRSEAELDAIGEWFDPAVQKWVSDQISDTSYNFQQEVERGERVVIGVNKYIEDEGGKLHFPIWKEDKGFVDRHVARLQRIRKERDPRSAAAAEKNLFDACRRGDNIVPPTVEAVKALLSTGEITATYKKAIGTE